jgi:hypothetical protein
MAQWILYHQMDIKRQLGPGTQSLNHRCTDGNIGHEAPIHNIDMNVVGTGSTNFSHLLPETAKIG